MNFQNPVIRAILSGVLLVLSWPPFSLTFLLPFAFIPFLANLVKAPSFKKGMVYSFLTFFIWTAGTMYWLAMIKAPGKDLSTALMAFILIPAAMLLPIIPLKILLKKQGIKALLALPFFWASYEFLHSNWDLAFTWLNLGFGLSPFPFFLQFYEYTGYLGGTVVILFINALLTLALLSKRKNKRRWLYYTAGLVAMVILINSILWFPKEESKHQEGVLVAAIQPNADSYKELTSQSLYNRTMSFIDQMKGLSEEVELIAGPEGYLKNRSKAPIVLNDLQTNPAIKALQKQVEILNTDLVIGAIGVWEYRTGGTKEVAIDESPSGNPYTLHNASIYISPGKKARFSVKQHLVPFMERVPFLPAFPDLANLKFGLNQMKLNYSPWDSLPLFKGKKIRSVPIICLDAHFPTFISKGVNKEGNCLVVISNDSWAGKTAGYQQNAVFSSVLAVSFRKPLVRSANTGISLIMDSKGKTLQSAGWKSKKIIKTRVILNNKNTFYSGHPWLSGFLSLILSIAIIVVSMITSFKL